MFPLVIMWELLEVCCVLSDMHFVCLRAVEITQRSPLRWKQDCAAPALAVLGICQELSSTGAKSLCQMFGRGKELSWAMSRLMLNP